MGGLCRQARQCERSNAARAVAWGSVACSFIWATEMKRETVREKRERSQYKDVEI